MFELTSEEFYIFLFKIFSGPHAPRLIGTFIFLTDVAGSVVMSSRKSSSSSGCFYLMPKIKFIASEGSSL